MFVHCTLYKCLFDYLYICVINCLIGGRILAAPCCILKARKPAFAYFGTEHAIALKRVMANLMLSDACVLKHKPADSAN